MNKIGQYAKFIAAILTAAVNAGVLALVPEPAKTYVAVLVAVVGAAAVYAVPNAKPLDDPEDFPSVEGVNGFAVGPTVTHKSHDDKPLP